MADPGEGPPGVHPPYFYLDQTEAGRAEKTFLETGPPTYVRVWTTVPPPPYRRAWPYGYPGNAVTSLLRPLLFGLVIKLNAKRSRRFDLSEVIFKCK